MSGILEGIRVLDLSATFMGPYCTLLMAEMGAEVWKVEPPSGDIARGLGPRKNPGMGSVFLNANRGKRSIVIDLKKPDGINVLLRFAARCDVFLHTMRGEAAERLGIDYRRIRKVNPSVVYCAGLGYGSKGPYGRRPAYDDVIQGAAGFAGLQSGNATQEPTYVAQAVVDKSMGVFLLSSVLAALFARERTGKGQSVEVPMFETMVSYVLLEQFGGFLFDPPLGRPGYARTKSAYRRPYRTSDGYISVLVYTDRHWESFFQVAGKPPGLTATDFSDIERRTRNVDLLYAFLEKKMLENSTEEWIRLLNEADIPVAPVNFLEDLLTDPHLLEVGFFEHRQHPTEGMLRVAGLPFSFSEATKPKTLPAPRLGEHTTEALKEVGYDRHQIEHLHLEGAIRSSELEV